MVRKAVLFSLAAFVLAIWFGVTAAFVPPACENDPSRTIFAGAGRGPCKTFNGDQAACEQAYYLNFVGAAASCAYVAGTCVGCGGENLACPADTCGGYSNPVSPVECGGDPQRTAMLGRGSNGSQRCRNLDHTSKVVCENAYYHDDDDFGIGVACFWQPGTGSCVGCGGGGSQSTCSLNVCDPTAKAPTAECTGDASRNTLIGFGGNESRRCRTLDDTDQSTCEAAYYEDRGSGLAVACWWDGNDCRGSGFDDYFAWNTCLTDLAPPVATATCPLDPGRTNLLGFGRNDTGACRQLDNTDEATCESAYYEDAIFGSGVACWWDDRANCRGSYDRHRERNACQTVPVALTATCQERTNLLGFGSDDSSACRTLDDTDQATCENSFYQSSVNGKPVACFWDGDDCRGCAGNHSGCSANACVEQTCLGEPERTNHIGFGSNGTGFPGGACKQLGDEASCEDAFYMSRQKGRAVACRWGGSQCFGSTRSPDEDACHVDALCTREPDRTRLGFGGDGERPCRALDGTDQETCEEAYYEHYLTGVPVACWWNEGDNCLGTYRNFARQNACLRDPAIPSATCAGDPARDTLIGFGSNRNGNFGGACRALDGTSAETCESAYYQHHLSHVGIACWWDDTDCRGSSSDHSERNACARQVECAKDPTRDMQLGIGSTGGRVCRSLDETDAEVCESAYYLSASAPVPVACWWNDGDCRGSATDYYEHNACLYELPLPIAAPTCEARTNLLGFGKNHSEPCRQFDGTDQETCETSYYRRSDSGAASACWWDGGACRGSSDEYISENVCLPDPVCSFDPERSTFLGFGNKHPMMICHQLDGSSRETCEDAFYTNRANGTPSACWWQPGTELCRGTSDNHAAQNACLHNLLPAPTCEARSTYLGHGHNDTKPCRQLDLTNQATCEDAFYLDEQSLRAIGCIWNDSSGYCRGTARWPAANACDPSTSLPICADPGRTNLLGVGGSTQAPCRGLDQTDEDTCEAAYYVNRSGTSVACWWNNGNCLGSNRTANRWTDQIGINECAPSGGCESRSTRLGFGAQIVASCRALDTTNQQVCEDAYYVETATGTRVACFWDAGDQRCLGCGRNLAKGLCPANACDPVVCANAPEREVVNRCREISSQAACENAWHIVGNRNVPAFAASCSWNEENEACFGCGPFAQASRECANLCEPACGNGIVDDGEECDDGNMFDGDCCSSTCQLEADGAPCTDRLFCTEGVGMCADGICVGGAPRLCSSCVGGDCDEFRNRCAGFDDSSEDLATGAALSGSDAANGMSFPLPPGTSCDDGLDETPNSFCDGNGMCIGQQMPPPPPPPTSTSTPTMTPTSTPTSTPAATRVPVGGACTETSECVAAAICLDGICTVVAAPAPTASSRALLVIVAALFAVAALRLRRRQSDFRI